MVWNIWQVIGWAFDNWMFNLEVGKAYTFCQSNGESQSLVQQNIQETLAQV